MRLEAARLACSVDADPSSFEGPAVGGGLVLSELRYEKSGNGHHLLEVRVQHQGSGGPEVQGDDADDEPVGCAKAGTSSCSTTAGGPRKAVRPGRRAGSSHGRASAPGSGRSCRCAARRLQGDHGRRRTTRRFSLRTAGGCGRSASSGRCSWPGICSTGSAARLRRPGASRRRTAGRQSSRGYGRARSGQPRPCGWWPVRAYDGGARAIAGGARGLPRPRRDPWISATRTSTRRACRPRIGTSPRGPSLGAAR